MSSLLNAAVLAGVVCLMTASMAASSGFTSRDLPTVNTTDLDRYVRIVDPEFGWVDAHYNFSFAEDYTAHLFNLTSLTYLNSSLTDRSVWTHTMVYVVPTKLNESCDTAFVWLTWGSNGDVWKGDAENDVDIAVITQVAIGTGCPAVAIYDIPNQKICFYDDPSNPYCASEDSAIAYTFNRYLYLNKSAEWLLLFPMAKAGIRSLDAIEEISAQVFHQPITKFIVSGASKRGWTTWLVGATDYKNRILAIVPVVLDALDFNSFIHRQWKSYNAFTFALQPYADFGLTAATLLPRFASWSTEIDPYFYRQRLTMPKLAINAVGDEFQLLDDQAHWVHDMPGEMKTILIKDADHILITNFDLVIKTAVSFCQSVVFGITRPTYTWSIDSLSGQITVTTSVAPVSVSLVQTTIATRMRDFRDVVLKEDPCIIHVLGGCVRFYLWSSSPASPHGSGSYTYVTNITAPSAGWTGFYLQLEFANGAADKNLTNLVFASPASILPLGYPFADCVGTGCNATFV
ncbi:GPI-anchored surface protein, putative [Bodo saltans]|uniref:GPI-anchored surface protein, putative n=1 Tax=Bodo saltans TaxID=75058 RepID=A0A0S4JCD9_BODSA|nr:GPI-anchored surface protein, putative [Bodo saltans]|eukprot:CUG89209.1 GPI-anchored surface protein, putative [Bodo saltans]